MSVQYNILEAKRWAAREAEAYRLIRAERQRQIEVEGWSPEHDDAHENGELLHVALYYRNHGTGHAAHLNDDGAPIGWPWDKSWWKPKDRVRNLVIAGALILAEGERRERAGIPRGNVDWQLKHTVAELFSALPWTIDA